MDNLVVFPLAWRDVLVERTAWELDSRSGVAADRYWRAVMDREGEALKEIGLSDADTRAELEWFTREVFAFLDAIACGEVVPASGGCKVIPLRGKGE